jgi:hypothetical protein
VRILRGLWGILVEELEYAPFGLGEILLLAGAIALVMAL